MNIKSIGFYNKNCALIISLICIFAIPLQTLGQNSSRQVKMLWPEGVPGAKGDKEIDKPTLTVFLPKQPEKPKKPGTAVVIFPGGGYAHLAMNKEGYKVAKWFNSLGIAAFVVKYRLGMRYHYPAQYRDGKRAVQMVRKHAEKWGVDPHRIGVVGFSAGGHLASTVGTHFGKSDSLASDQYSEISSRPDFMILIYPVITMKKEFTHMGSRKNLLGKSPDSRLVHQLSNETQVTSQTPPTFLVQGSDDRAVPVMNSVQFYLALKKEGVPAEMHLYEKGRHGFGLARQYDLASSWLELCKKWLAHRQLLP